MAARRLTIREIEERARRAFGDSRDADFAQYTLDRLLEELRTVEKSARRHILMLLVVALLSWLFVSAQADGAPVEVSVFGVTLANAVLAAQFLPLIAGYVILALSSTQLNYGLLLASYNTLYKVLHPDAYQQGLHTLIQPVSATLLTDYAVFRFSRGAIHKLIGIAAATRTVMSGFIPYVLAGYVVWGAFTVAPAAITVVTSTFAAVAVLYGQVVAATLTFQVGLTREGRVYTPLREEPPLPGFQGSSREEHG